MYYILYLPEATPLFGQRTLSTPWKTSIIFAQVKNDITENSLSLAFTCHLRQSATLTTSKTLPSKQLLIFGTEPVARKAINIICKSNIHIRLDMLQSNGLLNNSYTYYDYVRDRKKPRDVRSEEYFKTLIVISQFDIVKIDGNI